MAQRPDGKPAATERVVFTRPAAERISKVVRTVEAGDRRSNGLSFGVQAEAPLSFKVATFTGSWETGTYKTVTLSGSTNTASVYNWCNAFDSGNASSAVTQTVIFAKAGGTNSAIEMPLSSGSQYRMAYYTATSDWLSIGFTSATTGSSGRTIQFAFPTSGTATAVAVNHFALLPKKSTVTTAATRRVGVVLEAGVWRVVASEC